MFIWLVYLTSLMNEIFNGKMTSPNDEALAHEKIRNNNYVIIRNDVYADLSYILNNGSTEPTFVGFQDRVNGLWIEFGTDDCRMYFRGVSPYDFDEETYVDRMLNDFFKEETFPERLARDNQNL